MRQRDPYFDILKGIAIILVIVGHCIQFGSGNEYFESKAYFENICFRFIYSFHMPLFMTICGYFFYSSCRKRTFMQVVSNKLQTILIPIVAFGTISFVQSPACVLPQDLTSGLFAFSRDYYHCIMCTLWFLWAVLKISIIVALVQKYLKDSVYIYALLLLLFLIFHIPRMGELEKYMFPYFLFGYWMSKFNWWNMLIKQKNI